MYGELTPLGGGDCIPLLKPKLLVGRRDSCDIALRFPNVSSHHCELEFVGGYWRVRDLNSANGTKVNGVRVNLHWLYPGDELAVAKHTYRIGYTPQSETPPPQEEVDFSVSLLEKAGLERRPSRRPSQPASTSRGLAGTDAASSTSNGAGGTAKSSAPAKQGIDEDDVVSWLQEHPQDPKQDKKTAAAAAAGPAAAPARKPSPGKLPPLLKTDSKTTSGSFSRSPQKPKNADQGAKDAHADGNDDIVFQLDPSESDDETDD